MYTAAETTNMSRLKKHRAVGTRTLITLACISSVWWPFVDGAIQSTGKTKNSVPLIPVHSTSFAIHLSQIFAKEGGTWQRRYQQMRKKTFLMMSHLKARESGEGKVVLCSRFKVQWMRCTIIHITLCTSFESFYPFGKRFQYLHRWSLLFVLPSTSS